jgi:hypothetical protein
MYSRRVSGRNQPLQVKLTMRAHEHLSTVDSPH